jgi:hypothetical protein
MYATLSDGFSFSRTRTARSESCSKGSSVYESLGIERVLIRLLKLQHANGEFLVETKIHVGFRPGRRVHDLTP